MTVVELAPGGVSFRDLVAGAIADLVPAEGGSALLRDLVAQARRSGLAGGGWTRRAAEVNDAPTKHPDDAAIVALGRAVGLTPFERMTVALLVCLDEDPLLGRALAEAQHPVAGSRPSLGFLAAAFGVLAPGDRPVHLLLGGAGLAAGVLAVARDDRPLAERVLSLPTPISLALRGQDGAWPGAIVGRGGMPEVPLAASVLAEAERQGHALLAGEHALAIRTGSAAEGRAAAAAVARALGRRPVYLEGDPFEGFGPWLFLRGLTPVFCFELGPGERKRLPRLPACAGPALVVTGPEGIVDTGGSAVPDWTLGVPPPGERAALWAAAIGPGELGAGLASEHRHCAGRIAYLGRLARHRMLLDGAARPTREHVQAAAWIDEGLGLAGLAQALPDAVVDEALVTTPVLRTELALLLRCRGRDGLEEGFGASLRARYRPGVCALFVGPSGTGKTLAVGWLATRLGLPLYRVDLAAVTSKYIGETEKNLAQLLARAEHAEVVLLFDEADSMFGKRTDVKEANDRFANAQTNYLLQRIESFDGITILTSNSRSGFDNAFSRRLDAILEFTLPGPGERRALWLSHLGTRHRLAPRTINKLAATADLAGGHIRNVVLTAAVLARAAARPVEYADVLAGLVGEFRKLGRQVPPELRTEG